MYHLKTILFAGIALLTFASCSPKSADLQTVIFDTDLGPDYDDVGALTILHALADSGEVRILATISSNTDPLVAPCIDVINRYYGRPDLPIGAPKTGVNLGDGHEEKWSEALVKLFPHEIKSTADAPDAVPLYRQLLTNAKDTSVIIVTVGFLTNLANLLESPADNISPLNGLQLVSTKVKHLVSMAGGIPSGREFNVFMDTPASQKVFAEWPTRIIISGFEIGGNIFTGKRLIASSIAETPAKTCFTICLRQGDFNGRQSWDETAVLVAVRGTREYFNTTRGRMTVAADGSNTWQDDPAGQHEYLSFKLPAEEIGRLMEDMMMHEKQKNHDR